MHQQHSSRSRRLAALAVTTTAALAFTAFGSTPAFAEDAVAAAATHTIAQVQGTGAASPLPSNTPVTVDGIVTADHRVGGFGGIVVQTPGVGGDVDPSPGASDGIFVFLGANAAAGIAIGDQVSVSGLAGERNGQTQINASAGSVALVAAGVGLPAPVALPDTVRGDAREPFEGMLVAPSGSYALSSSHNLFSFGELWLNAGESAAVKSTELVGPGAEADAITAANKAARVLVDDGYSVRVTDASHNGEQPYFTADTVVRNGDTAVFPAAGMVLGYGFNEWRLQPQLPVTDASDAAGKVSFTPVNLRADAPPEVGGDVKLASFNVFNYFTTLSSVNSAARGAETQEEFDIQKSKIVAAINGLNADVVALMEIENSVKLGTPADIDAALIDLVAGLNAAAGSEVWAAVPTPTALNDAAITDFITSAIIYKRDAVTPVGESKTVIDETVWDIAREPIAQAFTFEGKTITVVANHFKSKSSPGGTPAPPEPADGQGFFNAERTEQAQSLLAFSQQLQAESGSGDVFLIGDFNAYAHEDPINVFTAAGWTDVVPTHAAGQYTYTFNGELGSLDHVLASPSVAPTVTGAGVWNINSPEWSDRGYAYGATEAGTPFRSSDHDPIVVGVSQEVQPVDINVVTVNDFHGRLEQVAPSGGAAVLAGAVKQVRDANPNTVFAAAGDLIGASTFTSFIQQDNPTIDALNAAGLDVSSVGNHEFDQGWDDLSGRVLDRANWEYLAANVYDKTTGKPALPEYYTETFEGVTVGFVGAVTNELPSLVSPDGIANLEVRDVTTEVNRVADQLRDGDAANGEADVVILLVHEGAATAAIESATDEATAFGKIVTGVDSDVNAIVSGHTHLAYNHVIDGRPVISSGQYGEKFGLMDLQVNPQTKELVSISNETLPLMSAPIPATPTTPAVPAKPLYPAVPEVQAIVADAVAVADVLGAQKLGDITAPFNRAKLSNGTTENRGGESTLGNFVADVQLWATQSAGAQIAFMNPGGLRTDMPYASSGPNDPDGNVTYKEAAIVQPFANTLVAMDITGAQLRTLLEQQWQPAASTRPFLKLGVSEGLEYSYNPAAAAGERIGTITLNDEAIDPAASYRIAVNSFLASGGDNFSVLASGTNRADTGKVDLAAMVDYLAVNSPASPDYAQRGVGVVLSAPADAAGYVAGETVTVNLSSLAFGDSTTPAPGTVELSLGGVAVASAPVDATVTDAVFDETGTATAQFTVPQGLDGVQQLAVTVAATGTAVSVPMTIQSVVVPEKVASITLGAPNKLFAKAGSAVKYSVTVAAASGPRATGTVEVRDGKKVIATIELTAGDKGKASVKLPKLGRGIHILTAHYLGSDTVEASRSLPVPLILW